MLQHICNISLIVSEIELYKKTQNLIAFVFLSPPNKNPRKAVESFKKLRDAAQEDKDF